MCLTVWRSTAGVNGMRQNNTPTTQWCLSLEKSHQTNKCGQRMATKPKGETGIGLLLKRAPTFMDTKKKLNNGHLLPMDADISVVYSLCYHIDTEIVFRDVLRSHSHLLVQ